MEDLQIYLPKLEIRPGNVDFKFHFKLTNEYCSTIYERSFWIARHLVRAIFRRRLIIETPRSQSL